MRIGPPSKWSQGPDPDPSWSCYPTESSTPRVPLFAAFPRRGGALSRCRCGGRGATLAPFWSREGLLHSTLDGAQAPLDGAARSFRTTCGQLLHLSLELAVLLDQLCDHAVQLLNQLVAVEPAACSRCRLAARWTTTSTWLLRGFVCCHLGS